MKLNIGCGNLRREDCVNIDKSINSKADVIADFDDMELNGVAEIQGRMCLHHFPNPESTLRKCKSLTNNIKFEQEPIRGVLIPERLCYYFSPFRHLKDNPEEKAPTALQWRRWFSQAGLRMKFTNNHITRFKIRGFLLDFFVFWFGSPRHPFYCHSADLEIVK